MKKLVTVRIPNRLLADLKANFPNKTQTEQILIAIDKGLTAKQAAKHTMASDYRSIGHQDLYFA